jgi:hypothetical protein
VEDLDNDLASMSHDEGEEGIDDINTNGYGNDNANARTRGCVRVKRWGAAKYREEYEQIIGLTERGRGLTVFDIFVNYSAQQYSIRIRSSS